MFIYALCRQANFGNAKILRAPITPIGPFLGPLISEGLVPLVEQQS